MSNINIEQDVLGLLEKLTGQKPPIINEEVKDKLTNENIFHKALGFSQFNELLIIFGYKRVTPDFFERFFNEKREINYYKDLKKGVDNFRETALLLYGNIRYAFDKLSKMDKASLDKSLRKLSSIDKSNYTNRHSPFQKPERIKSSETYYLGYIVDNENKKKKEELKKEIKKNPDSEHLLNQQNSLNKQEENIKQYQTIGKKNLDFYLASDHMDVYLATSMRQQHEFYQVGEFARKLFNNELIKPLKLRYFDPTQSYCENRIEKGLIESLMLKRAKCTIYNIQESDTFGKDSELAATLAQGKPVIAFIPKVPEFKKFKDDIEEEASIIYSNDEEGKESEIKPEKLKEILIERIKKLYPEVAWGKGEQAYENKETKEIIYKISDEERSDLVDFIAKRKELAEINIEILFKFLHYQMNEVYETRARTLTKYHPLSLQVNLSTGVSNGVLVVRTIKQCAELLESILLNKMEFEIEENSQELIELKEKISGSIYRVIVKDDFITNAFWNFYLKTDTPVTQRNKKDYMRI